MKRSIRSFNTIRSKDCLDLDPPPLIRVSANDTGKTGITCYANDTITRKQAEIMKKEMRDAMLKKQQEDEQKLIAEAERKRVEELQRLKEQFQMIHNYKENEVEELKKNLRNRENSIADLETQLKNFQSAEKEEIHTELIKARIQENQEKIKEIEKKVKQKKKKESEKEKWNRLTKGKSAISDSSESSILKKPKLKSKTKPVDGDKSESK